MRKVRLGSTLCVLIVSMVALGAGSASAAVEFSKHVKGNLIKGTNSTKAELVDPTTLLAIESKKQKFLGEITGAKTLTLTIDFEESTIGGLAAVSLSDKGGIILTTVNGTLCIIKEAPLEIGVLFTLPSNLHLEVPTLGELLEVKGSAVGKVEPINVPVKANEKGFSLSLPGTTKCKGASEKEDVLLLEKEHNGKPLASEEKVTATKVIEPTEEVEILG